MANGNLLINSEEISKTTGILNRIVSTLGNDMAPSVNSDFTALTSANLFGSGVASISKQISALQSCYQGLISEISSHENEFDEMENTFSNNASGYSSGYSGGSSGYSGSGVSNSDISVNHVDQGLTIGDSQLMSSILSISDDTVINKIVNFLNVNMGDDLTMSELLFNASKSGLLAILLKKFYGDTATTDITQTDSSTLIQREFLKKLIAADTLPSSISKDTILVAKDYLSIIANKNYTSVDSLLLDEKNSNLLSNSLLDLYDGNGIGEYNLNEQTVDDIRIYMDDVASENGMTVEEVVGHPEILY